MFVSHRLLKPDSIESRLYQEEILATASKKNTLCVLPTSLGKTVVAALVAAHRLETFPDSQILFLAPTRPLVAQHKKSFEGFFALPSEDFYVLTGTLTPEKRARQYDRKMIFATPQVIENDIKDGVADLSNFSLVIFDEAHRAVGDYAYPFVAKSYLAKAANPLVLALTASPGATREKIQAICRNLGIQSVEIRTETDEGVKEFVKEVKAEWAFVNLPPQFARLQELLKKVISERAEKLMSWKLLYTNAPMKGQLIELQTRLQAMVRGRQSSGYAFFALSIVAEIMKVEHAVELLETQGLEPLRDYFKKLREDAALGKSKAVRRIVADERIKEAMLLAEKLSGEGIAHPKTAELKRIVDGQLREKPASKIIVFSNYRNTVERIVTNLSAIEGCRPVAFIGQSASYGAGLKQAEQIGRLERFAAGEFNCLVGTSISEEGLHVPEVDLAVFYEPVPSEIRTIQRRGRVGRTKIGRIVFLVTKDTRDEGYYWSAHHKERRMKRILKQMKGKELVFEEKGLKRWLK